MHSLEAELLGWDETALALAEQQRGWTETVITQLRLTWIAEQRRVGIPVRDSSGEQLGLLRYQPDPALLNGQRKMLAEAGMPRELFPPPELLELGALCFLLEGEPDTIRAWALGLTAVGVPGAGSWQSEWAQRFAGRHVVVAVLFDCDQAGRDNAQRAAHDLSSAGVEARIIDLAPSASDGFDLTDWARPADTAELRAQAASTLLQIVEQTAAYRPPAYLTIQTLEDFAAVDEPGARELLGEPGQALIPEGSNVMIYGDGGAGKTTLTIDLACHLAAAEPWIGITVADTLRSLLVEDEGPRAFFRRKLAGKLTAWAGSPIEGRVLVVEKPWARFSFAEETHRASLAHAIDEHQLDIVFVGPVVVAGMEKAGTLQDVRAFLELVDDTRRRSSRNVTFVLVHHENKGGEVSGAWEGAGDTLIHLNAQGQGKTRLHIQKARHAPDYHLKTIVLKWADGEGYEVDEKEELDDDQLEAKIVAAVGGDPGISWSKVEERVPGVNSLRRRQARNRLLEAGTLVNVHQDAAYAYCEQGKTISLHTVDDPVIAHLLPARRRSENESANEGLF